MTAQENIYNTYHQSTKFFLQVIKDKPEVLPEAFRAFSHKIYLTKSYKIFDSTSDNGQITLERIPSHRSNKNIDLNKSILSSALRASMAEDGKIEKRRPYPSAGAKYPIELYFCVLREVEGLEVGVYHYSSSDHSYARLWDLPDDFRFQDDLIAGSYSHMDSDPRIIILLTAQFNKTISKYGDRGYRYVLLEAGHIGQNICTHFNSHNLAVTPYGGAVDEYIEAALLHIDGVYESHVYCLVVS